MMSNIDSKNNREKKEAQWEFCPICGEKLPPLSDNIIYCPSCGFNIEEFKRKSLITYTKTAFENSSDKKLIYEDISQNIKKPLWSTASSLLVPLFAFIAMEFIVTIIFIMITLIFPNFIFLESLINSTIFLIVFSLFEFFFILIPLISVRKYLKTPTFKNSFGILGIPINQNKLNILKEIFLGLGYAVVGIFLVNFVSLILELILSLFFDVQGIISNQNPSSEIDMYISSSSLFEIILLILVMLIVVGPSEEIAFRGYTQKGLVRNLGNKSGIIITALIFTMIHLLTLFLTALNSPISFLVTFILMFFPYFVLSLLLGLIFYYRDENLISPIVLHGVYNSLTILLGYLFYNVSFEALGLFGFIIIFLMIFSFISYYILKNISHN